MPEQISRYPETTLEVLESAGAACGAGGAQRTLTACPAERFCALPGGEICVYGIEEIPRMTQVTAADLAPVVCPQDAGDATGGLAGGEALMLGGALLIGFALGRARGSAGPPLHGRRRRGGR